MSAILFLYRDVLEQDLPWLDDIVRSKRAARLPVVLPDSTVATICTNRFSSEQSGKP